MKRILLALLLIPSLAFAGPEGIENDLISNPKAGTFILGRQNEAQTSISTDAGDFIAPSYDRYGNQMCTLAQGIASATNPIKAEDSAHVSAHSGFPAWGVANTDVSGALCGNGDYCPLATNVSGALYTHLMVTNTANSAVRSEDQATASGDAGVGVFQKIGSALSVDAANGDYGFFKGDLSGRLITAPAVAEETWQACSGAITNTTQTDIKAAVASNRIYVTSIGCNNTAAVASSLVFGDGASAIWQGAIGNSTLNGVAGYTMTFPVPLRGTSNTAFTVTLGTTATNTRCCAAGYISTN